MIILCLIPCIDFFFNNRFLLIFFLLLSNCVDPVLFIQICSFWREIDRILSYSVYRFFLIIDFF